MRASWSINSKALDDMDLTISVTMSVKEWDQLHDQLADAVWPGSLVWQHIHTALSDVAKLRFGLVVEDD